MENEFATKKAWSKSELKELAAAGTESGPSPYSVENAFSHPHS